MISSSNGVSRSDRRRFLRGMGGFHVIPRDGADATKSLGQDRRSRRRARAKVGAPGRIRTCGLRLRRPSLYPAELRARVIVDCGLQIESGCLRVELAYLIFWARAHTSHLSSYFSVKPTLRDRKRSRRTCRKLIRSHVCPGLDLAMRVSRRNALAWLGIGVVARAAMPSFVMTIRAEVEGGHRRIRLDRNENAYGPSPKVIATIERAAACEPLSGS